MGYNYGFDYWGAPVVGLLLYLVIVCFHKRLPGLGDPAQRQRLARRARSRSNQCFGESGRSSSSAVHRNR